MVCHGHFTEILVGAPEKPEIRPPSPPSLNFSEAHGRAQSHHCVHTVSQRLSPAVGGASYFRHCLPVTQKHLLSSRPASGLSRKNLPKGSSGGRRQRPLCSGPAGPGPRPRRARKWRRGPALRKWRRRRRPRGEAGRDPNPSRRRGPGGSGRGGQSPGLPRSAPGLRGLPRPSASPAAVTGPGSRPPFPRCPRTACRRLAEEPRCRGSPWVPLSVAPGLGDEGHDTLKDYDISVAALAVLYHPW